MRAALLAALLFLAAGPAGAFQDEDWSVAAYGDIMTVGNSGRHLAQLANGACGAGCATGSSSSASYGGRLGFYSVIDDTRLGVSAGGLSGGPLRGSTTATLPSGSIIGTASASTARLLGEGGRIFRFNDSLAASVGLGFGIAAVNETTSWTCTGSLAAACGQLQSGTSDTGWFAWEMNYSLIFEGFEAGLRYGSYARGHRLPWAGWGYFAGWRF